MGDEVATAENAPVLDGTPVSTGTVDEGQAGVGAQQDNGLAVCDRTDDPGKTKRKRRTNEEMSLSGLIQNKKKRQDKRVELCQQIDARLTDLSR